MPIYQVKVNSKVYLTDVDNPEKIWADLYMKQEFLQNPRYKVDCYEANLITSSSYNKGKHLGSSDWKKTPLKARKDFAENVGPQLVREIWTASLATSDITDELKKHNVNLSAIDSEIRNDITNLLNQNENTQQQLSETDNNYSKLSM